MTHVNKYNSYKLKVTYKKTGSGFQIAYVFISVTDVNNNATVKWGKD
jgi:hypothetical protein